MNKRDRHHQRFVEYLKFFQGQLVTTWPVLTEVTHHVPVSKAVEIIALVRDGALEVIRRRARTRLDEEVRGPPDGPCRCIARVGGRVHGHRAGNDD